MEFSLLIFVSLQSLPNSSWDLKIPPLSMKTGHIVLLGEKKSHKIQTGSKEDVKIASLFKPSTLSAETGR